MWTGTLKGSMQAYRALLLVDSLEGNSTLKARPRLVMGPRAVRLAGILLGAPCVISAHVSASVCHIARH